LEINNENKDNFEYFLKSENLIFNDYFDINNILINDFENSEVINFEECVDEDFDDFFFDN
jgi:hypothetical protein